MFFAREQSTVHTVIGIFDIIGNGSDYFQHMAVQTLLWEVLCMALSCVALSTVN